jgi:hypothetical protein
VARAAAFLLAALPRAVAELCAAREHGRGEELKLARGLALARERGRGQEMIRLPDEGENDQRPIAD